MIWESEFDSLLLFVRTFLFYFCIYMYLPIYTIIEIWSIIIINLFTLASKFGVKIKKHRKPGQNRKRTGPPAGPVLFRFCPGFRCFFLQQIWQNMWVKTAFNQIEEIFRCSSIRSQTLFFSCCCEVHFRHNYDKLFMALGR